MPSSVPLREAEEVARQLDMALRADDPRLRNCVHVALGDGSAFFWDSAFCETKKTSWQGQVLEWLFVFTEHHGFHVFPWEDVLTLRHCGPQQPIP